MLRLSNVSSLLSSKFVKLVHRWRNCNTGPELDIFYVLASVVIRKEGTPGSMNVPLTFIVFGRSLSHCQRPSRTSDKDLQVKASHRPPLVEYQSALQLFTTKHLYKKINKPNEHQYLNKKVKKKFFSQ